MSTEVLDHFERLEAAFAARDMDALVACWDPNIIYRSPAGTITGIADRIAAEHVWLDAFPDARTLRTRQFVVDNVIIVEGRMIGTHEGPLRTLEGVVPATGKKLDGRYVSIMTFVDGKVTDQSVYFDRLDLMAQLGLGAAKGTGE